MIGELELELAIADANQYVGVGDGLSFAAARIELEPVLAYARRFAKVQEAAGRPYDHAAGGGFMLGFRLGVMAARLEKEER